MKCILTKQVDGIEFLLSDEQKEAISQKEQVLFGSSYVKKVGDEYQVEVSVGGRSEILREGDWVIDGTTVIRSGDPSVSIELILEDPKEGKPVEEEPIDGQVTEN